MSIRPINRRFPSPFPIVKIPVPLPNPRRNKPAPNVMARLPEITVTASPLPNLFGNPWIWAGVALLVAVAVVGKGGR